MGGATRSGKGSSLGRFGGLGVATALALALITTGLPVARPGPAAASVATEANVFRADSAGTTPTGGAPRGAFATADPGRELPELRTASSSTHEQSDGSFRTTISSGSVNYRVDGAWRPIDNTLVQSTAEGYALENAANRYTLRLPESLARPMALELAAGRFGLALRGAAGSLSASENSATYAEALPGVDLTYRALHDSVKEEILLHSPESQRGFVYDLTVPQVLAGRFTTVSNDDGSIDFLDPSGARLFRLAAPFAYEQARGAGPEDGPVAMSFERTQSGGRLTVTADDAWLDAPERRFPVVIDPDVMLAMKDCNIINGSQSNLNNCGGANLRVGFNGTEKRRALIKFELDGIPEAAQVLGAEMELHADNRNNSTATNIQARALTETWTDNAVTWIKRHAAVNWSDPGSTFDPSSGYNQQGIVALTDHSWYLTRIVQGWLNRDRDHIGLTLKQQGETTNNVIYFTSTAGSPSGDRPRLFVSWDREGRGERDLYSTEDERLNDRMALKANVASGNLLLRADDLSIAGRGIDLAVGRYYNSRPHVADGGSSTGAFGPNWVMNTGADMGLQTLDEATVVLHAPSGYKLPFTRPFPAADYVHPPGFNAELREVSGGFELEFDKSHVIWEFTTGGRLTRISDGTSAEVSGEHLNHIDFAYDPSNRLSSITDTRGRVTEFDYHPTLGFVDEIEDPAGRIFSYGYTSGRLSSYTDPDLGVTTYDYDPNGNLDEITTPEGSETILTYDSARRVKSIKRVTNPTTGAGDTKSFVYNAETTVVTDERNNDTTFRYFDSALAGTKAQHRELGLVRLVTDAAGNKSSSDYTTDANVVSYGGANVANQDQTTLTYDTGTGNVTGATLPTGAASTFTYNSDHTQASGTDSQGNICEYDYGPNHNLSQALCGKKGSTPGVAFNYVFNDEGNLTKITDGEGHDWDYDYNTLGELELIEPPNAQEPTEFTYDSLSRLATVTDGENQVTTYSYDALDRVTLVEPHSGPGITYDYDLDGNMIERTDASGTTTMIYNDKNELEEREDGAGVEASFTYDPVGNLKTLDDPGGLVTYTYNSINLLTGLIEPGNHATDFHYDDNRNPYLRTQTDFPNGAQDFASYDFSGRPTLIRARESFLKPWMFSKTYSYEDGPNDTALIQSIDEINPLETTTYTYDTFNRLEEAEGNTDYSYTYDNNGNIDSKTVGPTTTNLNYNNANELTEMGSVDYDYDDNGNLVSSSSGLSLDYNSLNQTTSMNGVSMDYADVTQDERTSAGSTGFSYTPLGLSSQDATTDTHFTRDNAGRLIGMRQGGDRFYYHLDHLGSVIALTDDNGDQVGQRYEYEPYGRQIAGQSQVDNPWRFASGFYDPSTGFLKFGTRYYDPEAMRWTQPDPEMGRLQEPISLNRYAYAACNPISVSDPSGRFFDDLFDAAVLTIVCAIDLYALAALTGITIGGLLTGNPVATVSAGGVVFTAMFYIENCL